MPCQAIRIGLRWGFTKHWFDFSLNLDTMTDKTRLKTAPINVIEAASVIVSLRR